MASPLIHALRQQYPQAHIAWLVQPECADLLMENDELDEVILWQRKEWKDLRKQKHYLALLQNINRFRKKLKAENFDLVLDLQGLLKSGLPAWFTGAPRRVGLGSREGSRLLMTETISRGGDNTLIASEYRFMAEHLGLETQPFDMDIQFSQAASRHAAEMLPADTSYAVICPFTTRPQKHWFNASWIELVKQMQEQTGLHIVMLGGPADLDQASEIEQQCEVVNLVGKTGLQEAAAIISECNLLIGVDTGLTHMGIAYDRPTICLFGSTSPYLDTGKENSRVIYHQLDCSPCRRSPDCDGRFDCMQDITVTEIMQVSLRSL